VAESSDVSTTERFLVVNADDFGLTSGVNRGIIEAHERGLVTSASLMVRALAAAEAASYAKFHATLGLGLHLDLAEWFYRDGQWLAAYEVINTSDSSAVREECERQLARFEELVHRPPTHLDSHQHLHLSEPVRSIMIEIAARLQVPLRSCTPNLTYFGGFYGQTTEAEPYLEGISRQLLVRFISNLAPGWTELGCHPGYADGLDSVYLLEREEEVRVLCDPVVREAIKASGVKLRSFAEAPIVDAPPRGIEGAPRFRG
jgi:chitin disaccharide deacetylase